MYISSMEQKLQDKIITGSVKLFNESGINQTSFRNIASLLKISDGHIRYYFKTKESLLIAIFNKMNSDILLIANQSKNDILNTEADLKNKLQGAFNVMVNYSFFFVESPKTIIQFPELTLAYKNLVEGRKSLFLSLFQSLTSEGFFKKTFSAELQESAFYSIFIISDSWIRYYVIMNNQEPNEEAIDFHCKLVFNILLPYIKV